MNTQRLEEMIEKHRDYALKLFHNGECETAKIVQAESNGMQRALEIVRDADNG